MLREMMLREVMLRKCNQCKISVRRSQSKGKGYRNHSIGHSRWTVGSLSCRPCRPIFISLLAAASQFRLFTMLIDQKCNWLAEMMVITCVMRHARRTKFTWVALLPIPTMCHNIPASMCKIKIGWKSRRYFNHGILRFKKLLVRLYAIR